MEKIGPPLRNVLRDIIHNGHRKNLEAKNNGDHYFLMADPRRRRRRKKSQIFGFLWIHLEFS